MNQLQADFANQGLTVLALNLDEEASAAQSFLLEHPARFKIADGTNQACATSFHVEAMPSSYLIVRAGKVRYIHHGFRDGDVNVNRNGGEPAGRTRRDTLGERVRLLNTAPGDAVAAGLAINMFNEVVQK